MDTTDIRGLRMDAMRKNVRGMQCIVQIYRPLFWIIFFAKELGQLCRTECLSVYSGASLSTLYLLYERWTWRAYFLSCPRGMFYDFMFDTSCWMSTHPKMSPESRTTPNLPSCRSYHRFVSNNCIQCISYFKSHTYWCSSFTEAEYDSKTGNGPWHPKSQNL